MGRLGIRQFSCPIAAARGGTGIDAHTQDRETKLVAACAEEGICLCGCECGHPGLGTAKSSNGLGRGAKTDIRCLRTG